MSPVVEAKGLVKIYRTPRGEVPVLHGVDLTVAPGEFWAITGPSGSGKTTLLNLLALLDAPTAGELVWEGVAVHEAGEAARVALRQRRIGMIFQKFCLLPHRTVRENILFRARYAGSSPAEWRERAEALMERMGLAALANREARLLSGGEMQRVAIARALLLPPALVAADEPTGNLDARSAEIVMETLAQLRREGIAVVLVTHNPRWLSFATAHVECREGRLWRAA